MSLDSSKKKSNWGGKREGAGRPKGSMNESSKERARTKAAYIARVNKNADKLFNAQLDLAIGEKYLLVRRTKGEGKKKKTWVEVVTDIETIKQFIDDGGASLNDGEDYYYMTTKPANNMAIDSLLNRSLGKPEERVDITSGGEQISANLNDLSDEELHARIESYLKDRAN